MYCTACSLNTEGKYPIVIGRGPALVGGVVAIGEAPGEYEERQGEAFVGPAGVLLNTGCKKIGIQFDYITNTTWHRPRDSRCKYCGADRNKIANPDVAPCPKNPLHSWIITNLNRDPHKDEITTCWNLHVANLLCSLKPRLLVAFGSVASLWLCDERVTKAHGKVFPSTKLLRLYCPTCSWDEVCLTGGPTSTTSKCPQQHPILSTPIKVFVAYHPAHVLRKIPELLPSFEGDLLGLKSIINTPEAPTNNTYGLVWDLETTGLDPHTSQIVGVACYDSQPDGEDLDFHETVPSWLIDRLAGSITFNGASFDLSFLYWSTRNPALRERLLATEVEDVMLMARILQKPFGSLQALSAMELGAEHEGIKDMAKRLGVEISNLPVDELTAKAKRDVKLTYLLCCLYKEELKAAGLWRIYELERAVAPIIRRVEVEGIPIDRPYLEELDSVLAKEFEEKQAIIAAQLPPICITQKTQVCTRCGTRYGIKKAQEVCLDTLGAHNWQNKIKEIPPNPNSKEQVKAYLFSQGVVLTKKTKKGNLALDAEVLASLDHPFIQDYIRMQTTKKQRDYTTTMLQEAVLDLLGGQSVWKFRASFNQLGAVSGRLSSGESEDELA